MNSTIVGAIISGAFLVAGVIITLSVQGIQSRRTRQQAISDDKRTRIRHYFATIYRVASMHMYNSAIMTRNPIYTAFNNDPDYFVKRQITIMEDLARASIEAEEVLANLTLEGGNQDIIDAYYDFGAAFDKFINQLSANYETDGTEMGNAYDKLSDVMVKKYSELDKVITKYRIPEILRLKHAIPDERKNRC